MSRKQKLAVLLAIFALLSLVCILLVVALFTRATDQFAASHAATIQAIGTHALETATSP